MSQPPRKSSGSSANRPGSGGAKGGSKSAGSQPANRQGGQAGQGGSNKAGRSGSYQTGGGSRPPATRQPVGRGGRPVQQQRTGFSASVDRALPPFSAQRYVAIWVVGMIILIAVILLLLQPWNGSAPKTGQVSPTAQSGSAAGGATAAPQPAAGQNTSAPAPTSPPAPAVAVVTATQSLSGPGKYMTIDTAKGKIVCKLYTDPSAGVSKTIANFEAKAKAGYFNGLIFHRVEGWVIQGGDPTGTGSGGGTMPAEYNDIPFGVGALGVARGGDPAINNDSQLFIIKDAAQAAGLVGQYTNWGQVVQGMDVVNKIAVGDKINTITVEDRQQ
jgi:peptidyl-prolyl cis-trans isomerase B (cyclophilin B)